MSTLVVGGTSGASKQKAIAISGQERLTLPDTYNWTCGRSSNGIRSPASNVAWVELKNPTTTLSVSVSLDGLPNTYPELFVYASKDAALTDCTTFGKSRKLTGSSSVLIGASASAYVLVASGAATGVYTLSTTTEDVVPPPPLCITVASSVGGTETASIALDGHDRVTVPDTYNWTCGRGSNGIWSAASNVAWVELKNPTAATVSVSVTLDGLPNTYPALFAYSAKDAALTDCLTFGKARKLADPSSVVIGPNASAYVLVAAQAVTGVYTLAAKTENIVTPTSITLAATAGSSGTTPVVLDGRDRATVPDTYNWTCGRASNGTRSAASNVAWVELKNPTARTLSVSVVLDGLTNTYPDLYAYAAKDAALTDCLTFGKSRTLTGSSSVVIQPNGSAWVLVSATAVTRIYTLSATTDLAIDP